MQIQYHQRFTKRFRKLLPSLQGKTTFAIRAFVRNPHDPRLRNHALSGRLKEFRAFSVTGDVRIIFQEFDHYALVLFLDVGTHNQVYR